MDIGDFPGVNNNGELQIRCFASIGTNLFAGCSLDSNADTLAGGVYLSSDSGVTWINTNLPSKYAVYSLFANGRNLFAGTYADGVWRSTDNGTTWLQGDGIPFSGQLELQIDAFAAIGTNLFASTSTDARQSSNKSGVYLSTDNGATWTLVNTGLANGEIFSLAVLGKILFAGDAEGEVSFSTNSGASWRITHLPPGYPVGIVASLAVMGTNLFASSGYDGFGYYGVYHSTDSGTTWDAINNGLTADGVALLDITSLTVDCANLFAGTFSGGVFLSTDSGANWVSIDNTSQFINFYNSYTTVFVNGSYLYAAPYDGDSAGVWRMSLLPGNLSVYLKPDQLSAKSHDLVSIPVYASSSQSMANGSITFRINMRTDLLTPESITSPIPGATFSPLQVDDSGAWITIMLPPDFSVLSDTLIADVSCRAYVTDTNATAISLAGATVSNSSPNCLSVTGAGNLSFTLTPDCATPEFIETLSGGQPFSSISIQPNPASGTITVGHYTGQLSIIDPLGRSCDIKQTGNTLDVSSLPPGVYFLSDGYARGKLVKE